MDYLWTPWRYQYVSKTAPSGECVFCAAAQANQDGETLIVHRAARNFVILNRFPYTNGHVMIVPFEHIANLTGLPGETLQEMMLLAREAEKHLTRVYHPDGLNLGRSAGAGIADHLHMHVLPRWAGDTNFMTVTGETRVLPEDLAVTWEKLRHAFAVK